MKGKTDKNIILNETHTLYSKLYETQNIEEKEIDDNKDNVRPNEISKNDQELFDNFISSVEITHTKGQLNKDKSPGEDELSAEIYKTFE